MIMPLRLKTLLEVKENVKRKNDTNNSIMAIWAEINFLKVVVPSLNFVDNFKNLKGYSIPAFSLYTEVITKYLEVLKGFIIGEHISNKIYANYIVRITDPGRRQQEVFEREVKEIKKGLNVNCKNSEFLVFSKRDIPRSEQRIVDSRKKQVQKFINGDGHCETKTRRAFE